VSPNYACSYPFACEKYYVRNASICARKTLMNRRFALPAVASLAGFLLVGVASCGYAAKASTAARQLPITLSSLGSTAAPRIQFADTNLNFGEVKSVKKVKHTLVFTNTGNATLEVSEVRPSCGCTTSGTWDRTVEPGKTDSIPVEFNPASFSGKIARGYR
jgi:hypothetical protein